jgi:hypothetical protein
MARSALAAIANRDCPHLLHSRAQFYGTRRQAAGIANSFFFAQGETHPHERGIVAEAALRLAAQKSGRPDARENGMGIEVLAIAAATLAVVWIIVLWGSRYFGPR